MKITEIKWKHKKIHNLAELYSTSFSIHLKASNDVLKNKEKKNKGKLTGKHRSSTVQTLYMMVTLNKLSWLLSETVVMMVVIVREQQRVLVGEKY